MGSSTSRQLPHNPVKAGFFYFSTFCSVFGSVFCVLSVFLPVVCGGGGGGIGSAAFFYKFSQYSFSFAKCFLASMA